MSAYTPKQNDKNKYVGIEIEFFTRMANDVVLRLFYDNKVLASFCKLGTDSSIDYPYYSACSCGSLCCESCEDNGEGWELKVLSKVVNLKRNLIAVQTFLKRVRAETNHSCGLHVHLDARNVDASKMFINLVNNINNIEGSVPGYRLENDFSNSIKGDIPPMLEAVKRYTGKIVTSPPDHTYRVHRYRSINIESLLDLKTIEVRCHEGTVSCAEIYKWSSYLCEVAYRNKLSNDVKTYINKRIETRGVYEAKRIAR